jgi:putative membrane protein
MDYREVDPDRMILRDHLARDRTVLANERTLLAYVRTAIALWASGVTLLKVFWGDLPIEALSAVLLAIGVVAVAVGIRRFRTVRRGLRAITQAQEAADDREASRSVDLSSDNGYTDTGG